MLTSLPIDTLLAQIVSAVSSARSAVVVAPPGAGKTTRLPPAIVRAGLLPNEYPTAVMLQPRRVAARAAAARIAEEQGWMLGEEVGYQIRFDNRTSPRTRLRVVTEGILTRRIQADPFLEGVGCVILDEFHERSIHTDLALALLREIRATVRPDLRIVVMSATMDPQPVADFLSDQAGESVIFKSEGRLHTVRIDYLDRASSAPVWEKTADAIHDLSGGASNTGHVLAFLPGIGEIRRTAELVSGFDAELHILHSSVSVEEQDRALRPSERRKLILSTNIAETSLTIDGVRTVIDSGLARVPVNDTRFGFDRLELHRISRASADQRAGRAGRTAPGRCVRLWTRAEDAALADYDVPEIQRIDLAGTMLAVRAFGIRDPAAFRWFEPPRAEAIERADRLLWMIGAIDERGAITPMGERLSELPLHPRLARLLTAGADAGCAREAALIAALLSEGDIVADAHLQRRREAKQEADSDLLARLELLQSRGAELKASVAESVRRIARELERYAAGRNQNMKTANREAALLRAVLDAYPDRVTVRKASDPARGTMIGGRSIVLEPSSVVRRARLFISLDPRETGASGEARVSLASAIEETWLAETFPHLIENKIVHRVDADRGRVVSFRERRFAGLLIGDDPVGPQADPEGASRALADFLANDASAFFEGDEDAAKLLARLRFLQSSMPELELPEFNQNELASALREACEGCTSVDQVKRYGLKNLLVSRFTHRQRTALAEHAPEAIAVPSGSKIKLRYEAGGTPVLAVRLQELFGLAETPRIAGGRVPVVIHLLGPNYRPVQVTSDLKNFWNTTYREVRKELRVRYPKHPWPEDPWNAPAVSVGRRRRK